MRGGDGDVVEKTEAHRPAVLSVMPWRAHQRKRARAGPFVEYVFHCADGGAGGHSSYVPRPRRGERVRIERYGPARGLLDERDVLGSMDATDFGIARWSGLLDHDALLPEFGSHGLHDLESLDAFGMTRRRQMIGEDRRCEESE
jgi:hypothetical protein